MIHLRRNPKSHVSNQRWMNIPNKTLDIDSSIMELWKNIQKADSNSPRFQAHIFWYLVWGWGDRLPLDIFRIVSSRLPLSMYGHWMARWNFKENSNELFHLNLENILERTWMRMIKYLIFWQRAHLRMGPPSEAGEVMTVWTREWSRWTIFQVRWIDMYLCEHITQSTTIQYE